MGRKVAIAAMVLLLFNCTDNAQVSSTRLADKQSANATTRITITFAKSPYADFLFYLLYRSTGPYPDLATAVAITDIPPLDGSSFLPEDSITSGVANYAVLYQLATHHDDPARLSDMLKKAEPRYPAFYSFWEQRIGPNEDQTAKAWAKQDSEWNPVAHLEKMERLKFPFSSIKIDLLALDPQGSSMQGPPTIFTMSLSEFRAQIETNLFGTIIVTKAALTYFREKKAGQFIQFSSVGGRIGPPGRGPYSAAKWGVEGFSEVLSREVAPLGIKVTIVEPGGFRTDFAGSSTELSEGHPAYDSTVGATARFQRNYNGKQPGDPKKAAQAIIQLTQERNPPLRLLLGSDACAAVEKNDLARLEEARIWKELSVSTDF